MEELNKAVGDLEAAQKEIEELKLELAKTKGKLQETGLDAESNTEVVDDLKKNVADLKKERGEHEEHIAALKKVRG